MDSSTFSRGGVRYSTDEQIVGTWVDGKPIYQKTVTNLSLVLQWDDKYRAQAYIDNPIQNLDKLVGCEGVGVVDVTQKTQFFGLSALLDDNNGKILIMGISGDKITTITFRYTKTTDSV